MDMHNMLNDEPICLNFYRSVIFFVRFINVGSLSTCNVIPYALIFEHLSICNISRMYHFYLIFYVVFIGEIVWTLSLINYTKLIKDYTDVMVFGPDNMS